MVMGGLANVKPSSRAGLLAADEAGGSAGLQLNHTESWTRGNYYNARNNTNDLKKTNCMNICISKNNSET